MSHSTDATLAQMVGTVIGSIAGMIKGGMIKIGLLKTVVLAEITANKGIDTAILAVIGATAGFLTTKVLTFLYEKIKSKINAKKS